MLHSPSSFVEWISRLVIGNYFKEHVPNSLPKLYLSYTLTGAPVIALVHLIPSIYKRRKVVFQFGIAAQNGEHIGVFLVQQFNGVRERAILTALIDTEIPNYSRQKNNRAFHEEVALLAYPTSIEVKHYRVACFVGIRNVRHETGVYRVASVALAGVVKIDNVKLGLYLVAVQVVK